MPPESRERLTSDLSRATAAPAESEAEYSLLTIEDGAVPKLLTFRTKQELVDALYAMVDSPVVVYGFVGSRLRFTKGPQRYVVFPDGERAPLFHPDEEGELEGYLGEYDEPDELQRADGRLVSEAPRLPTTSNVEDEFAQDELEGLVDADDWGDVESAFVEDESEEEDDDLPEPDD